MKRVNNRKRLNRCRKYDGGTVTRYLEDLMARVHPYSVAVIIVISANIFLSALGLMFLIWVVAQ